MPREWHDWRSTKQIEEPDHRSFCQEIVADKKPYFMRLIYPKLMKEYNTYIKSADKSALREFQMSVGELLEIPDEQRTERQGEFLRYYWKWIPVGANDCVMNRICRRFEMAFDGYLGKHNASTEFDYTIMKSGMEYKRRQHNAVLKLYEDYNRRLRSYVVFAGCERVDKYDFFCKMSEMRDEFERECAIVCPNLETLCDILLDICYTRNHTKRFAWEICGDEIIRNLLRRNGGVITYPVASQSGDIKYRGEKFSMQQTKLEDIL